MQGVVEREGRGRRHVGSHAGGGARRDRPDLEGAADARVDLHGRNRRLDDRLDLGDLDGAQVGDIAPAHRGRAGEREHGVGAPSGDLDAARGALGVAREPDDAARCCRATAHDDRVDGGGDLRCGRVGDVSEVGGREQHGLLEPVVDAQGQVHAIGERVGTGACGSHRGRRPIEHRVGLGRAVHGQADHVSVAEHERSRGASEKNAWRRAAACHEERGRAHCRCGRGICHVGVVRGADDPELAPAVLEKAHRGEREIRVGREATKLRLELVERRAEYRFADRPTLGESDRARDGGGNRGDAADLRLLLDDDDLGRQELSAHDAPRFFLALTSARLTSTEVVTVGARVEATTGREGSGT